MHLTSPQPRWAASLGLLAYLLPALAQVLNVGEAHDPLLTLRDASDSPRSEPAYEPEFAAFDKSIIGRAPPGVIALKNNVLGKGEIQSGSTQVFVFERPKEEQAELRRRAGDDPEAGPALEARQPPSRTVYVSANTCKQPLQPEGSATTVAPPQLTLTISTINPRDMGTKEAPSDPNMTWRVFDEGAAMFNISTPDNVFIEISAPKLANTTSWAFEVAASTDKPYHGHSSTGTQELMWMDSDASGALMVTRTASGMDENETDGPFVFFASHIDGKNRSSIAGVRNSYCGLQNHAEISASRSGGQSNMIKTTVLRRSTGDMVKQQFHLSGLDAGTAYDGILATVAKENTAGGGGLVFGTTQFSTRQATDNSCQLVSDLEFCNMVSYKVPNNATNFNATTLAKFYDDNAKQVYANFEIQLAQVQCETDSTQAYSLARTCNDCREAYKDWLCSVSIPRCVEVSESQDKDWLYPRNFVGDDPLTNTSRNSVIQEQVSPGPHRELLPCDDLCYDLVQSCPNQMGFACPTPDAKYGFAQSYHVRELDSRTGEFKCNFPDDPHFLRVRKSAAAGVGGMLAGDQGQVLSRSVVMYGIAAVLSLCLM